MTGTLSTDETDTALAALSEVALSGSAFAPADIRAAYDAGRFGEALALGGGPDALRRWPGAEGRVLAARLAMRLGAPRLCQALSFRAHRDAPDDDDAAYYFAALLFGRRGAWHTLRWLRRRGARSSPWLRSLEGRCLAGLRDFERAEPLLEEAARALPDEPWLEVERITGVLTLRDRREAALAAAEALGRRAPELRPALHQRAQLLSSLGRLEEAHALLAESPTAEPSYELLSHRAELAFGLGRYADTEEDLVAAMETAALLEPAVRRALCARAAEAAYLRRAHRRAAKWAAEAGREVGGPFAEALARLEDGVLPPRVCLNEVPHVRQHHVTCAPASLCSVAAYHGDPQDQRAIADAITYAGTPLWAQRRWAEERGYLVRELDVTLEAARALIDAGLPFVLSTFGTVDGHAQVVIGYDEARRSLLVRDPSVTELVELRADFLEQQAWSGPHGMVFAPDAHAAALASLRLPGGEDLEARHRLSFALSKHDVPAAREALRSLEARASDPEARPVHLWSARLELARYEGRRDDVLEALDALLALHPDARSWVLQRGEALRGRGSRASLLAYWREHVNDGDPALLESLAEELRTEPAHRDEAARLLRRALWLRPTSGMAHHVLADLEVDRAGDLEEAVEQYRFAACLSFANEHFADAYFHHARLVGREAEALALLERRVEDAPDHSTAPAQTLIAAYADRGNPERGIELVQRLAERRPDDAELCLVAAHAALDAGDEEAAARWLARAERGPSPLGALEGARARLARHRGDLSAALEASLRVLEVLPFDLGALIRHASLLDDARGPEAAVAFLDERHRRTPDDRDLTAELCIRLRGHDDARARELLRSQVERQPQDMWSHRELSLALAREGHLDEAIRHAEATVERFAEDASARSILGGLLEQAGEHERARQALRRAVELHIDDVHAIERLGRLHGDPERTREDARFVLDLLERRTSRGPGLVEAALLARVLPHEERTSRLGRLLERCGHRPDAWEAVARAEVDAGALDEALAHVDEALARFPSWTILKALRAEVLRTLGRFDEAEAAWREALASAPGWSHARLGLAASLERAGSFDEAAEVLEEGVRRAPKDISLRTALARILHRRGDGAAAFELLLGVLKVGLDRHDAFSDLDALARELGRERELEAALRDEIAAAPQRAMPWLRLAQLASHRDRVDERLDALRRALELDPRFFDAADLLAETLAFAGRLDEALAACPPRGWVGPQPIAMRGRRAWVLARRGELEEAIRASESLLAESPAYAWGRRNLCDWLDHLGRKREFHTHAEELVAQAPTVGLHHVYLADARTAIGDTAGARVAYARALELDPRNSYPATRLLDLQLEGADVEGARETLAKVAHTLGPGEADALTVRVEVAASREPEALAALERLLRSRANQQTMEGAAELLVRSPFRRGALAAMEAALLRDDVPAAERLGFTWANVRHRAAPRGATRILRHRERLGPAGVTAVSVFLERMADGRSTLRLAWLWLRHRRWLRRHAETWASFGYALRRLGWASACARWLADWEGRVGVQRWMLLHLVVALWMLRRPQAARPVVDAALALPSDGSLDAHPAWRAFEDAIDGDARRVEPELELLQLDSAQVEGGLVPMVEALAAAERLSPDATARELADALSEPLDDAARWVHDFPELRAPWDATLRRALRHRFFLVRWWLREVVLPRPQ